ncbi:MAG: cytochrome c3 family protein [Bacteroidota bacterium]
MTNKPTKRPLLKLVPIAALLLVCMAIYSGTLASDKKAKHLDEESKQCLKCHAQARYVLTDSITGDSVKMKMYAELRIDPVNYLRGTHGAFKCTDCHSSDYNTVPHPASVKFETGYTCLDCHGGDEAYASFHFETIDEEYSRSVHADSLKENFNCWSCHNPHTYKLNKADVSIADKVAYDNEMCFNCHGNQVNFEILSGKKLPNFISNHDWLPNQALHFNKVRCIDCHAAQNDSLMVAHLIKPSKGAVRKCVECHSTNSILMSSLYKHEVKEKRNQLGFYNGVITNEAYIIGANRNYYLNVASIGMFLLTLLGIIIHSTLRIAKTRKNADK